MKKFVDNNFFVKFLRYFEQDQIKDAVPILEAPK